jgi:hypothetical protein
MARKKNANKGVVIVIIVLIVAVFFYFKSSIFTMLGITNAANTALKGVTGSKVNNTGSQASSGVGIQTKNTLISSTVLDAGIVGLASVLSNVLSPQDTTETDETTTTTDDGDDS